MRYFNNEAVDLMAIDLETSLNERDEAPQPLDLEGNTQLTLTERNEGEKANAGWFRDAFLSFPVRLESVALSQLLQTAGASLAERADR